MKMPNFMPCSFRPVIPTGNFRAEKLNGMKHAAYPANAVPAPGNGEFPGKRPAFRGSTVAKRNTAMASTTAAIGSASPTTKSMGTIAFAGTFGTIIEWYDFLIYGTAAALVFNKLFFPTVDPLTGTLAALATYAVGFVARPVGGALFGYFGDRIGRKSMLMLTMMIMGLGTFLVGLLPTYGQVGILAPILLVILRFVQGLAL